MREGAISETETGFARAREELEGAFATPSRFGPEGLSGCLHRADGSRVALSERFGGHLGDYHPSRNPDRVEPPEGARRLAGRSVYLGHLMTGHYGHFITETLSTFWIFDPLPAGEFDHFVFHDFHTRLPLPEFARLAFEAFGLDPARITVVGDAPVVLERVVVPERLMRLNHSVDPALAAAHRRIAAHVAGTGGPAERRLYLSRRRVGGWRGYANEGRIEAAFAQAGFEIVHPQELGFAEQLRLYARARILAGVSGSALHNVLFAPPGVLVVEVSDMRYPKQPAPTQILCNRAAGAREGFVGFRGRRLFPPRAALVMDPEHLQTRLQAILAEAGEPAPPPGPLPPPDLAERFEYLARAAAAALRRQRRRLRDWRAARRT